MILGSRMGFEPNLILRPCCPYSSGTASFTSRFFLQTQDFNGLPPRKKMHKNSSVQDVSANDNDDLRAKTGIESITKTCDFDLVRYE